MSIKHPEDIDLFFKDRLAASDVPYNASHWTRLEAQLSISAQRTAKIKLRNRWLISIASILLIASAVYFWPFEKKKQKVLPVSTEKEYVPINQDSIEVKEKNIPTELFTSTTEVDQIEHETMVEPKPDSVKTEEKDHTIFW